MVSPFQPDDEKIAAIRAALPATGAGIYLDVATAGPFPTETARALQEADEWELRVGRGGPDRDADVSLRGDEARAVLAALLGASADEIVLTTGTGDALARLRAAVGPKHPLIVRAHVDSETGAMRETIAAPRLVGALLVLDVSHSAGAVPIDVSSLDVDGVVLDGHRWLLGPEGTGAIWLGPRTRDLVDRHELAAASDPLPRRSLLGLGRSVGWLEMYIGLPWAYARTAALVARLADALAAIRGVELVTPREAAAAICTFRIAGWHCDQVAEELSRRVFALIAPVAALGAVRASVGCWNREDELDRFAAAAAELAAHTPDSLPRRPSLMILPADSDPSRETQ
ncbi:MAG: aminotransferase class V-fold PLP-dependent enzyme [Candidatus Limnocylindrales bacterium]